MNISNKRPGGDPEPEPVSESNLDNRDSGIDMNSYLEAFNKVVDAKERKKVKLSELLSTEEDYLTKLESIENILKEAEKSKTGDSTIQMPRPLRSELSCKSITMFFIKSFLLLLERGNSSCLEMSKR